MTPYTFFPQSHSSDRSLEFKCSLTWSLHCPTVYIISLHTCKGIISLSVSSVGWILCVHYTTVPCGSMFSPWPLAWGPLFSGLAAQSWAWIQSLVVLWFQSLLGAVETGFWNLSQKLSVACCVWHIAMEAAGDQSDNIVDYLAISQWFLQRQLLVMTMHTEKGRS